MGLGKAGATASARIGGIVSVVLLSAYRIADYVLTDDATLTQLIGTLATDVVKVGIATGASIAAAMVLGATTFAVGPLVVVLLVGTGVTWLLDHVDNSLGITKRVIAGLDELEEDVGQYIARKKQQTLDSVEEVIEQVVENAVESARAIAINWVRSTLREYLSPARRIW